MIDFFLTDCLWEKQQQPNTYRVSLSLIGRKPFCNQCVQVSVMQQSNLRQRFSVMTELQTIGRSKPSVLCTATRPQRWHSAYTQYSIRLTINMRVNEVSVHLANLCLRPTLRTKDSFIKTL